MSDEWNLYRIGTAAAATTSPGRVPQYGLAYDLGSAKWQTAAQFRMAMRDIAQKQAQVQLQQIDAQQRQRIMDLELQRATNYQKLGYGLTNAQFPNAGDDDENWFERRGNDLLTGFNLAKATVGNTISSIKGGDLITTDDSADLPDDPYGRYKAGGGILSEEDFNSFDDRTKAYLIGRAEVTRNYQDLFDTPGIKQGLEGLEYGYHGLKTPFVMVADARHRNPLLNFMDPMWFERGKWARAWREGQDMSLGNAIVNSVLAPHIAQDRLEDWRRNSSIYQLTSMGVEFGATWYVDPGVISTKGAGASMRIARNELPLNEQGSVFQATTQALQREQVTANPLAAAQGRWRAGRINAAWQDVENYAKTHSYANFSNLHMFKRRDLDGQSAAAALHWAFRNGTPEQIDLTRQLLHGDPKAYQQFEALKRAIPEELEKFSPGAQTFIDAIEATKTKIPLLEREAEDLMKTAPNSPFHEWSLNVETDARLRDIAEAQAQLEKYAGYRSWMDNLSREPMISQVNAPTRRFFMDNQFGITHQVMKWTRPMWIQRANSMSMHDVDMGAESIRRQFEQYDHLWGYKNPEALDASLRAWQEAPTSFERYQVALDVEEKHLIDAAAQYHKVDPGIIRVIYDKIVSEQNKMFNALQRGKGAVYSAAPDLSGRLAAGEEGIKLLSHNEDEGLITLELMDGGRRTTVTVPDEVLTPKVRPVDPTQTPNYYQPVDTRNFHLQLRRNEDLITLLQQSGFRYGEAALMDVVDRVGTKFNAMWKPLQLFRLGWPQRVLMDEQMRAMAVLGIDGFIRNYGPATGKAINNAGVKIIDASHNLLNVYRDTHTPLLFGKEFKPGRRMNIGPGPVSDALKRTMDPIARDQELMDAPKFPEALMPVLDNGRFNRIVEHISAREEWQRGVDKHAAWTRASEHGEYLKPLVTETQAKGRAHGAMVERPGEPPVHPVLKALSRWEADTDTSWRIGDSAKGPRIYDPVTGNAVAKGYAIPLRHTQVPKDQALAWYAKNRELLAARGYRIFVDDNGNLMVAAWFNSKRRTKAVEFAQFADSDVFDLGRKVKWQIERPAVVEDPTDFDALYANGELRRQELATEEVDPDADFDFQIDSLAERAYRAAVHRRSMGEGRVQYRSSDGQLIEANDAYAGHQGQLMRSLISSQGAIEALSDGHGAALSLMRRQAVGHKTYHPPVMDAAARTPHTPENRKAVEYFHKWSELLNSQIAHSPIWSKMLQGWDDEKIVRWLNETPEGAVVKREVMHEGRDPELWVNEHRSKLNYYLPSRKLQRLLAKGRLTPSQLRRDIPDEQLPDVFGPDVEFLSKKEASGRLLGWVMDRVWYGLGTVPIDTLSRHPFARAMYDLKLRALINTTDSKWLDGVTIARYERQARNFARDQVRKTLWDLTDQTNFTDALRFIAPFWGAQQEAIVKWGKIVSDRPETVMRMFDLQRAVYQNFPMVDEEGQPVERDLLSYHPTDRVIVRIPSVMRKTALGKALETIGSVGIPLGSANTVLQGEMPLLPGPGPLVTIPADKFLRVVSDTYGTEYDEKFLYRWLFPIGRPQHGGVKGVMDQVLPGWGKRVMALNEGEGGIAYANLYTEVAREMQLENERKGIAPPTPEEIEHQARFVWGLRIAAGLVAPVQMQFRPKHQFLIDAAHKYQRDYGQEWFDKFMEDYGTSVARYATSSSNTPVGIPPTSAGMEEWSQNKKLIAKYPEWGGAIISPDAYTDDFSSDAYYAQFQINLGPGDSTTLREQSSTKERFAEADARAGWYEYRKVQSILEAELANRGLHSLQQAEAADLLEIKKNFVADLSKRLPAWREDYNNFSNDIYTRVGELQQFAFQKQFDNRPDMQGVRQYLIIRDQVATELDRYHAATGGSRSLQAQENTPLRDWFYDQVGQLVQANPAFGEFYSRYLTQDTLEQGSGS